MADEPKYIAGSVKLFYADIRNHSRAHNIDAIRAACNDLSDSMGRLLDEQLAKDAAESDKGDPR